MVFLIKWNKSPMTRCRHLRSFLSSTAAKQVPPIPAWHVPPASNDTSEQSAHIGELGCLGRVHEAREVFNAMPHRVIIACNSMILAYCNSGMPDATRSLATVVSGENLRTGTILLSGYACLGRVCDTHRVFDEMPARNVVAWNAMISCYVKNGGISLARRLFDAMASREVMSWNVMLTGYCHSRQMVDARNLFEQMPVHSLFSWTQIIFGYVLIEKHDAP
jgi:pentatricopeptide repeat protein